MTRVTPELRAEPPPAPHAFHILNSSSLFRSETVKPGTCGPNSLFVGRIGDWTWETVSALCGTDVFKARDARGAPTYLAFYYFHIKASPGLHLGSFTFGDSIEIASRLFNFGSESVLTLHRIRLSAGRRDDDRLLDYQEFYERPEDDCVYVENFNRWVTRRREQSNEELVKSSPVGFAHQHLPLLPDRYSPRRAYNYGRTHHTFHDPSSEGYAPVVEDFSVEYPVDVTRDINGVGLIYFAAYFSIIDRAVLALWRHLGRSVESFVGRVSLDQKVCYLGNADLDAILTLKVKMWERVGDGDEVFNVVIEERATGRVLAVSTAHLLSGRRDEGSR